MRGPAQADGPPSSLSRNVSWSALAQAWNLALTVASALILARLLTPADYAVMAVVLPVIGMAHAVQGLGFGPAIMQAPVLDRRQLDGLFWLGMAVAGGLIAAILLAAPAVGRFAGIPAVTPVLSVATLSILFIGLATQPNALLARDLRFKAAAWREMIAATIGTGATVLLAAWTHSHWSLVAGLILIPLCQFILSAGISGWRPGRPIGPRAAGPLLGFGLNVWGGNLLLFAARYADNLVVARAATPQMLGIYDRTYRVLFNPLNQASIPLGRVLVPTLAQAQDDPPRYREMYWRAVALLLLVCHPGLTLAIAYPATVIGALLGPAWVEGAGLVRWFALGALFQIYLGTINWLFLSQGRGRDYLRLNLFGAVVTLASFVVGIRWGVEGLALAFVICQAGLILPIAQWLVTRRGPIDLREANAGLFPHAAATLGAAALALGVRQLAGVMHWPELIATGLATYFAYAAVLYALPQSRPLLQVLLARGWEITRRGWQR